MSCAEIAPPPPPLPPLLGRDAALRASVVRRLAAWPVQPATDPALRHAAVALVLADAGHGADLTGLPTHEGWSDQAALILTRRAGGLRRHAGQWALPGGRMDPGESPEQAALRELAEEVGLRLQPADVLGRLDDCVTRSGFCITPVVVWGSSGRDLVADPAEVASIHRIPVSEFLRPDSLLLETIAESPRPVLRLRVGDNWIAAPTAAMLLQFTEVCIRDRATRVDHYDQPLFAWR